MALLRGIARRARRRAAARTSCVVTGDAGVGQEPPRGEIVREAEASSRRMRPRATASRTASDVWCPIAEPIRAACGIAPDASHDDVRTAVAQAIVGSDHVDDEVEVAAARRRACCTCSGIPSAMDDVDPSRARDDAVALGSQLLERVRAARRPLVRRLADLHWADDSCSPCSSASSSGLRALPFSSSPRRRPELPRPVDAHARPPQLHAARPRSARRRLGRGARSELLGPDVDPALVAVLHERSGGNPFFVEELAALLRECGPELAPETRRR